MPSLEDYRVAPFKQRNYIESMFPHDHASRTGICFGLCGEWMARHKSHKGESAQDRIDYVSSWSTIMHANIKQRLYQAENWHMAQTVGFPYVMDEKWLPQSEVKTIALNENGMRITKSKMKRMDANNPRSVRQAVRFIKTSSNSSHQYTMIGFTLVGGGAHATCGYKSGGKVLGIGSHFYYFEPNFGEFKVGTGDMENLFQALIAAYRSRKNSDGDIVDHKIKAFFIQIIDFI